MNKPIRHLVSNKDNLFILLVSIIFIGSIAIITSNMFSLESSDKKNNHKYPTVSYNKNEPKEEAAKYAFYYQQMTNDPSKYIYKSINLQTFGETELGTFNFNPEYLSPDESKYVLREYEWENYYEPAKSVTFTFYNKNENNEFASFKLDYSHCPNNFWSHNSRYFVIECYYDNDIGSERIIYDTQLKEKVTSIFGFIDQAFFSSDDNYLIYKKYSSKHGDLISTRPTIMNQAVSIYKLDLSTKQEIQLTLATASEDYYVHSSDYRRMDYFDVKDDVIYFTKATIPVSYSVETYNWYNSKVTYLTMDLNGENIEELDFTMQKSIERLEQLIYDKSCGTCNSISILDKESFLVVLSNYGGPYNFMIINTFTPQQHIKLSITGKLLFVK